MNSFGGRHVPQTPVATPDPDDRPPAELVADVSRILRAMREGVREALLRHKLLGQPIVVWRDGAVTWIPAEEIEIEDVEEQIDWQPVLGASRSLERWR